MITLDELNEAIAECQGERNPNSNTCIKLAAFYILRNEMYGKEEKLTRAETISGYSMTPAPTAPEIAEYPGTSEFSRSMSGRPPAEVWGIIDEVINTIEILQPRLYASIMRRISE